jgi:hypothetical protein
MCGIKMTFFFYQTKVPFHKKAQLASGWNDNNHWWCVAQNSVFVRLDSPRTR